MNPPIHFKGTDYPSVEAMPPDIRLAYEQYQADLDHIRQHVFKSGAAPAAPAWGGPRAPGAVPVPVEFDGVTSLGPASAVFGHGDGIQIFPNFGTPAPNELVLYRDGFAYRTGSKDLHLWRWEEVAVIVSNDKVVGSTRTSSTDHEYTLTKTTGEKVILADGIKGVEAAIGPIKQQVFARLLPPLAEQYSAGEALAFGPVTIKQPTGLQLSGKPHAWADILDIKVERGRFTVTLRDSKKHEVRASAIPNIELLCQLIGVNLLSPQLGYF